MSTDNNNHDKKEQLKLDGLNKIFGWIEDKETKAVLINKYHNNKEHRVALKAFLDDMVKALEESTAKLIAKKKLKYNYPISNDLVIVQLLFVQSRANHFVIQNWLHLL